MAPELQRLSKAFSLLLLMSASVFAGIRGPGKYAGIVIFDHWDTCYLYSGAYLMYISEKRKEALRPFAGKSILIDAEKVFQPINPGDGLITKFKILGLARTKNNLPDVRGLKLTAIPEFGITTNARFLLIIENQGKSPNAISTREISPTLFGSKEKDDLFSPSDGNSHAVITRVDLESAQDWESKTETESLENGRIIKSFSIEVENLNSLHSSYVLRPGEKIQFSVILKVSPGSYDFIFGYGGGVHEGKGLASNLTSFRVSQNGIVVPSTGALIRRLDFLNMNWSTFSSMAVFPIINLHSKYEDLD